MVSSAQVGESYGLLAWPVSQGSDDGKVLNDPLGVNRLTGPRLSAWMTQTYVTNTHRATLIPPPLSDPLTQQGPSALPNPAPKLGSQLKRQKPEEISPQRHPDVYRAAEQASVDRSDPPHPREMRTHNATVY